MNPKLTTRTASESEVTALVDWYADAGHNPGLHDAECFFQTDPHGFLVAVPERESAAIGGIAAISYGNNFGVIGLLAVRPLIDPTVVETVLRQAALERLGMRDLLSHVPVSRSDSPPSAGFVATHHLIHCEGLGGGEVPVGAAALGPTSFDEILRYDTGLFPSPRPRFLASWLRQDDAKAFGIRRAGQKLAGYGVIRRARHGYRIGPLFADDESGAESIFRALAAQAPRQPLFLDVPDATANPAADALARRHNLTVISKSHVMVRGTPPTVPMKKVYGITTPELG